MYNPTYTLIQTFVHDLKANYKDVFGDRDPYPIAFLETTAKTILDTLAQSDALYHDLEHTLLVTSVGQEILKAKRAVEGATSVTPQDWLHFVIALLCHDIGYIKGACKQDNILTDQYVAGQEGWVTLPPWATDAALTPYHVDRSKQFVAEQFAHEPLVQVAVMQRMIELTRFPVPKGILHQETLSLPGLARAADLIGQLGDRHYLQKLPGLFHEFEETGANRHLGYQTPADVRAGFPDFYWNVVHPYIKDAIAYLSHTEAGQDIVIDLYANVLTVEFTDGAALKTQPMPPMANHLPVFPQALNTRQSVYQTCEVA